MRLIDADALDSVVFRLNTEGAQITRSEYKLIANVIFEFPTIDAVGGNRMSKKGELIRCRDCKHKPAIDGVYEDGFDIVFPDMICPCQCDDGWYSWIPDDDWYCANAERKEDESNTCN